MTTLAEILIGVETLTCGECGLSFAVPQTWVNQKRRDHTTWYCPNGHSRVYRGKSREEELQEQVAREQRARQDVERSRDFWRGEHEQKSRSLVATRGVVTRLKNRVAKGVCPCCSQKFKDLREHMTTAHPDWNPERGAAAIALKSRGGAAAE